LEAKLIWLGFMATTLLSLHFKVESFEWENSKSQHCENKLSSQRHFKWPRFIKIYSTKLAYILSKLKACSLPNL